MRSLCFLLFELLADMDVYRSCILWVILWIGMTGRCVIFLEDPFVRYTSLVILPVLGSSPILLNLYMWYLENKPRRPWRGLFE